MDYHKHGLKVRTINAVIRKKVNSWLESIEDEELKKLCQKEVIVTGGSIASMLLGEKVNDFDLYFQNADTVEKLAKYYVARFKKLKAKQGGIEYPIEVERLEDSLGRDRVRIKVKSAGVAKTEKTGDYHYFEGRPDHEAGEYVSEVFDPLSDVPEADEVREVVEEEGREFEPVFLSSNAVSLRGKIQLVLRFFGTPEEIHKNYDFVHCTNYWTHKDGVVLNPDAMEALLTRELRYMGSLYPLASVIRTRKFIERGWRVNAGQYLKMVMQLQELDLKDPRVFEEQLTGVDVAYFTQLIERLHERNPEKIDAAYLTEIIDRMF